MCCLSFVNECRCSVKIVHLGCTGGGGGWVGGGGAWETDRDSGGDVGADCYDSNDAPFSKSPQEFIQTANM